MATHENTPGNKTKPAKRQPGNDRGSVALSVLGGFAIAGGAGLASLLGFRWWRGRTAEPEPEPEPEPKPKPKPTPSDSGRRDEGSPPNISGDPKGYNSARWPNSRAARQGLAEIDYLIEVSDHPLTKIPSVGLFQREWNAVIRAAQKGQITNVTNELRGLLAEDGTAGANTLNAIEIAGTQPTTWKVMVDQAPPQSAPTFTPGTGTGDRAIGNPPNATNDPDGYNDNLLGTPRAVRIVLSQLGIKIDINDNPLTPPAPNSRVLEFQRGWNDVIFALDQGKITLQNTASPWAARIRGVLTRDGTPGKLTLRAVEIAAEAQADNVLNWDKTIAAVWGTAP